MGGIGAPSLNTRESFLINLLTKRCGLPANETTPP